MIKRNQRTFNWINRLTDMGLVVLSYEWSVWFWIFSQGHDESNIAVHFALENRTPLYLIAFGIVVVFQYGGLYDSFRSRPIGSELVQLFKYFAICVVLVVGWFFLTKLTDFSRGVMVSAAASCYTLLACKRIVLRGILRTARRSGYNQKHVLLVGSGHLAKKYAECVRDNPQFGYRCAGYVGKKGVNGLGKHMGGYDRLEAVLGKRGIDEVVIALEQEETELTGKVLRICEEQGIRTGIIPIYNDYLPESAAIEAMDGVRLINLRTSSQDLTVNRLLKRLFDVVFASLVLVVTSPLMLLIAVGVKLSSPGPVLFRQKRVGKDRKEFTMYKFRSMVVTDQADVSWSKETDKRITPFGAVIRKLSLDELPQFFNVLRGEMSVVGPRPELPYFVERYRHEIPLYMVKHQVKPGITGWAQVNGYRGDTSIEKRVEYDLWYIENWSLYLDLRIIVMTVLGGMVNGEKNLGRRR